MDFMPNYLVVCHVFEYFAAWSAGMECREEHQYLGHIASPITFTSFKLPPSPKWTFNQLRYSEATWLIVFPAAAASVLSSSHICFLKAPYKMLNEGQEDFITLWKDYNIIHIAEQDIMKKDNMLTKLGVTNASLVED